MGTVSLEKSFFGRHDVTLDEAGRIAIPRSFREKLQRGQVYLARGVDTCIRLYTVDDWAQRVEEIASVEDPDMVEGSEIWLRYFANAAPVDIDKQGRVLVPEDLREFAGLSKDCKVVGMYRYIDIWDKERFVEKDKEISQEAVFKQRSDAFARRKKELKDAGNSAHAGIAGGNHTVPRAEGQG